MSKSLAVRKKYRAVAADPRGHFAYPVGRASARRLGYGPLKGIPAAAVDRFVGIGNPFRVARLRAGDRVLDVGCGSGLDAFVAAKLADRVVGLDLTPEMLPARRTFKNVTFRAGDVEALPFADGAFTLVISNGALNLVPDKRAAFREIHRVLAPGGRFAAADLVVRRTVPAKMLRDMDAWST